MSPKTAAPKSTNSTAEVAAIRAAHLMPLPGPMFAKPIQIIEGKMQFLFDENGKEYLDGFAGVATVSIGHSHPHFISKLKAQIDKLQHEPPLYLHPAVGTFAERLADKAKTVNPEMEVCFFTNSGSEANEMAAFVAKTYTGRHDLIAVQRSYHGRTLLTTALTGQHNWRNQAPYPVGVSFTPTDYAFRFDGTPEQCTQAAIKGLEQTLNTATQGKIAAFYGETIMGVGGLITPGREYFKAAVELVHKHGGLFICDEVQAGVGRTGEHYFGIKHYGAKPDIIVMAKGLGNGYPIGAIITTKSIAKAMEGLLHYNTFGGGPMAIAAADAVMDIVEKDDLAGNSKKVGDRLMSGLSKLQLKDERVGDVRGMGLMVGVELVKDKKSKEFAPDLTVRVVESMKDQGVLVGKGGLEGNTLRIQPPLCWTVADADRTVAALEQALKDA
ncbi:MAG: aspartate aminotransferase family protein [Elusimicrobia bacterium CG11_big_fil_rev_8_21_14_0_20_64_6]|nr:MAG: aspartate aminotransferase family protein [Elusimicrobia bacterium CG11_big_fil_rev_8_21_14_0_20_64_6]